jgi:hypothetical protein
MSDLAVSAFGRADLDTFQKQLERLEALKVGNVRSLINQEVLSLERTEGDAFNQGFNN